ncbi:hypothetical protein VTN77DRAFT_5823 [Rasamsonia byssochlamydoides]|uniref:uncharacterized protein n=1 Tax=Rasamsonia byssochlamydoides TaxID=89139 RepID=UPI00374238C3
MSNPSGQQSAKPGQMRWRFIDFSKDNADNLTQVKRHVMQEYMRQKRLENQRREGTAESSGSDERKPQTKKRQRARRTKTSGGETSRRREGTDEEIDEVIRLSKAVSPPLKTVLSAARTDPFDTLPLQLSLEDQHLFDFYVNEMPACSYGSHFRTKKAHNWYAEVFVPEAMKGAVTFVNTVLVHAANTWAWVHNETETRSTLLHRQRAISMLKDHMSKFPDDVSDNAITACMSAAALEDFDPRPGRKEISWIHMRQARRMIRDRGGPAAFENTKLAMLINWQDYILAGYETDGPSFYFEHNPSFSELAAHVFPALSSAAPFISSLPSPPSSTSSASPGRTPSPCSRSAVRHGRFPLSPRQEVRLQCEEFIDFLNRCEQLAHRQRLSLPKSSAPTRHSAFQDGNILHQILAAPPGQRFTASGNRKQFISRLASTMMLNAALWDYRSSIPRTEAFLKSLVRKVLDSEVDMSGSVEALLQILLACKDGFDDDESSEHRHFLPGLQDTPDFSQYSPTATSPFARPWFVGRMLKIAKRLSLDSWLRVNGLLFSCLTLQVQDLVMPSWESELRHEILKAPLTSYVMPALQ